MKRITGDGIYRLAENEIFVFGSNSEGHHMGGAAWIAYNKFGAIWGCGEGIQGQSYAIPTMDEIEYIHDSVIRFIEYAKTHPEKTFLVTQIGCGIAGYTPAQIAPLFKPAIPLENIHLTKCFWDLLK